MRLDAPGIPQQNRKGLAMRARCLVAVAGGLSVLAAAGCSSPSGAMGTDSATITIAAIPGVNDAPLYLAKREGLFASAGLPNVVIKSYSTESALYAALRAKQADIAASDYGDIFYHQDQSAGYAILADGYDATTGTLEVLTLPGSSITQPTRLANQKVGLPDDDILSGLQNSGHPISLEAAAASQVLYTYMGNGDSSVQWEPMSQQQEVTDLENGKLKAILVGEPYIYEAESQVGAVELMDACSGPTANMPLSGYVATNSWARANPTAVADFRSAIARAQSDAALFGPIQKILPAVAGMTKLDADLATIGTYPTSTSTAALQRVEGIMADADMISVPSSAWTGSVPAMIAHG